ncbi:hypothetical protein HPB50_021086 [Hyalomma asiaticum]|uniref:Uncharacterized protein n=1 Tax=Hyalomma asiaticum TaxID=266040 RepID=A0ACB7TKZ8_HYAAI|nr:hypothetical protein HPB50_021086 [Hyalomma asiaticum]
MEMAAIMSEQPAFSAELLIDAIKQHPVLFDKSHPRYKEVEFKKELWMKIAADLGVTGTRHNGHGDQLGMFLIGLHPSEQQKIHDELDTIFGSDKHRPVTSDDLKEMKYLECCIKEAQRLYPSVNFLTRECEEPLKLVCTVTFPAGTIVRVSVYSLHRDESVFPKPEEFHPERFFPENVKGRHPFAYIPFSAGPRNCIATGFSKYIPLPGRHLFLAYITLPEAPVLLSPFIECLVRASAHIATLPAMSPMY